MFTIQLLNDLIQKDLNVHHEYGNLIMAINHLHRDWLVRLLEQRVFLKITS